MAAIKVQTLEKAPQARKSKTTKIISLFNEAGGVGKTTVTHNLGYHLALQGKRVLLIDMDPQASLTVFLGFNPFELDEAETACASLLDKAPLPIRKNVCGMDVVLSNISLSRAEIGLVNLNFREGRLKEAMRPIHSDYDFILIDCPPSLGQLVVVSLMAATHVLIPVECQFKAFMGSDALLFTIGNIKKFGNPNLKIAGFIPSKYASVNSQDRRTLAAIQDQFGQAAPIYEPIPRLTAFADASEQRIPLVAYNSKSAGVKAFDSLAAQMDAL
ncbi:MAG: ParA family protein [Cyanobacteria bacterium J06597_1]